MKKPKAPKKSAQEVAVERRQTIMLDKEIEEQEDRFRAMSRGKLGKSSLLGGAPRTRAEAAGRGGSFSRASLVGGSSGYGSFGGGSFGGGMFGGGSSARSGSSAGATRER